MADTFKPRLVGSDGTPTGAPFKPRIVSSQEDADTKDLKLDQPSMKGLISGDDPGVMDYFRHYLGRFIPKGLSMAGGTAGGMLGAEAAVPVGGAVTGAAAGSYVGQQLQKIAPRVFGQAPENTTTEVAKDALLEGAVPEGLGKGLGKALESRFGQSLVKKIAGMSSTVRTAAESERQADLVNQVKQFLEHKDTLPESTFLPRNDIALRVGGSRQNIFNPPTTQEAIGTVRDKNFLKQYPSEEVLTSHPREAQDIWPETFTQKEYASDVPGKKNAFSVAINNNALFGDTQLESLINKGYSPSKKTFDAHTVYDELVKNGKAYEGIDPIQKNEFKNFLETAIAQKPYADKSTGTNYVLRYAKNKLVLGTVGAALGSASGIGPVAGAASVVIPVTVFKTLLKNPETMAIATRALKTGLKSDDAKFLTDALMYGLRGTEVAVEAPDDQPIRAYIDESGRLTYKKPSAR